MNMSSHKSHVSSRKRDKIRIRNKTPNERKTCEQLIKHKSQVTGLIDAKGIVIAKKISANGMISHHFANW